MIRKFHGPWAVGSAVVWGSVGHLLTFLIPDFNRTAEQHAVGWLLAVLTSLIVNCTISADKYTRKIPEVG